MAITRHGGGNVRTKRRTDITMEIDEIVVINTSHASAMARCERCAKRVRMITADEAAAIARVSTRTIYRLVESNLLHFIETPQGSVRICLDSIAEHKTQSLEGAVIYGLEEINHT